MVAYFTEIFFVEHDYVTELTKENIHQFIESVVVHQADGIGRTKNKTQKVEVNFRFIRDNWFVAKDSEVQPTAEEA